LLIIYHRYSEQSNPDYTKRFIARHGFPSMLGYLKGSMQREKTRKTIPVKNREKATTL